MRELNHKPGSLLLLFLFLLQAVALAQYKVQIRVADMTILKQDSIYLSGSFNNWDSLANNNYRLKPTRAGEKMIVLHLPAGTYEYKITRGNWFTVEKDYWGQEKSNHVLKVDRDMTVRDTVYAWRDKIFADRWHSLANETGDTNKISIYSQLANLYSFPEWYNADSTFAYLQKALVLLDALKASDKFKSWTQKSYNGWMLSIQESSAKLLHASGNYPRALALRLSNLKLAEEGRDTYNILWAISQVCAEYLSLKDYSSVLSYSRKMQEILKKEKEKGADYWTLLWNTHYLLADAHYNLNVLDSALFYGVQADELSRQNVHFPLFAQSHASLKLGNIYSKKGNDNLAYSFYKQAIVSAAQGYLHQVVAQAQEGMARLFRKQGKIDSALYYARQSLATVKTYVTGFRTWGENEESYVVEIAPLIAAIYKEKNQLDSAYAYLRLSIDLKDSLYNADKLKQFQNVTFNESLREQQQEQAAKEAEEQYNTRIKLFILIAFLLITMMVAFFLYRNNTSKRKANAVLQAQKEEVERTLAELRVTQTQLVQREKMASLGELTAGIAHEIQNPLNFVNNFSEGGIEFLDEAKREISTGNGDKAIGILDEARQTFQRVVHHGKRADNIVKGMLQHSRKSSGVKEPTDLNQLVEEYIRLGYHGCRARDKSLNTTIETNFDETIGDIPLVRQDIGRVLLNLINNAFYAIVEKKKLLNGAFEPTVTIQTKKEQNRVLILVRDNGMGVSGNVVDKVFQPFFTTKPTGEGTGLGLSLSYDIVTKGHGGELNVHTVEGEFTEFVVVIPSTN